MFLRGPRGIRTLNLRIMSTPLAHLENTKFILYLSGFKVEPDCILSLMIVEIFLNLCSTVFLETFKSTDINRNISQVLAGEGGFYSQLLLVIDLLLFCRDLKH